MGRTGRTYQGADVFLNVYDLSPMNDYGLDAIGLGIYHSGLEVHGVEYSYGGTVNGKPVDKTSSMSGLFTCPPGQASGTLKLRTRIRLGQTSKTLKEVDLLMSQMGSSYLAKDYHLLRRNCNVFCDNLSKHLLDGTGIPLWVNRAASFAKCCPCCFSGLGDSNSETVDEKEDPKFKAFSSKGYKLVDEQKDREDSHTADAEARRNKQANAALQRMQKVMEKQEGKNS